MAAVEDGDREEVHDAELQGDHGHEHDRREPAFAGPPSPEMRAMLIGPLSSLMLPSGRNRRPRADMAMRSDLPVLGRRCSGRRERGRA